MFDDETILPIIIITAEEGCAASQTASKLLHGLITAVEVKFINFCCII